MFLDPMKSAVRCPTILEIATFPDGTVRKHFLMSCFGRSCAVDITKVVIFCKQATYRHRRLAGRSHYGRSGGPRLFLSVIQGTESTLPRPAARKYDRLRPRHFAVKKIFFTFAPRINLLFSGEGATGVQTRDYAARTAYGRPSQRQC